MTDGSAFCRSLLRKNLKDQPASKSTHGRANFGSQVTRRIAVLGSCNGIVLCGIPYRGEGHLPHLTQRTGFYSLSGWLPSPVFPDLPGPLKKLHCFINNFLRLSLNSQNCKPMILTEITRNRLPAVPNLSTASLPTASELPGSRLQLSENSNRPVTMQVDSC